MRSGRKHSVTIREMTIDDLPAVYHLGERLFTSATFPLLYRTWDEYEVTHYFNTEPELCLVAEVEGRIVGFAIGTTVEKPGTAWKYGYLLWLGVKRSYQRTGMGRRLYSEMEKRMLKQGVRMVIVDTEGDNLKAISFFKKAGFSEARTYIWMTKTPSKEKE